MRNPLSAGLTERTLARTSVETPWTGISLDAGHIGCGEPGSDSVRGRQSFLGKTKGLQATFSSWRKTEGSAET